ncbi:unnamed protein product [Echinostoma caproni]|uniref:LAM_G_DOMAIN domain-containing protein n=1 Tax=Echinostoma caproni TaxID=27848 RepID=A0A183APF2_9TREM|nr:unnamed protein product [Echinostoma caproni]
MTNETKIPRERKRKKSNKLLALVINWFYNYETGLNCLRVVVVAVNQFADPAGSQGFRLYLEAGQLAFQLRTETRSWTISAPFVKTLNHWINIAVVWGKGTETLTIYVNRTVLAEKNRYTGDSYVGTSQLSSAIHLGCEKDENGKVDTTTMAKNFEIATVSLWYWPIQLPQYLTGGLELYLFGTESSITTTAAPVIDTLPFRDFSSEMEEYQPPADRQALPNPIYAAADVYLPMNAALKPSDWSGVTLVNAEGRNRPAYLLSSTTGYAKLFTFKDNSCPVVLSACVDGFSIGFWVRLDPQTKSNNEIWDLFEVVGAFRIVLIKGQFNVVLNVDGNILAFRGTVMPPTAIWFNIGFTINRLPRWSVDAYINGNWVAMGPVVAPAERTNLRSGTYTNLLLFGGLSVNSSAFLVSANDLTIVYRALRKYERHRFVGYTRTQLSNLETATYYWTPDVYILQDADSQIAARQNMNQLSNSAGSSGTGVNGFCLASLYKSKKVDYRVRSLDHWGKSWVPIFDMKSQQYMLLGRQKSSTVTLDDLTWNGQCLYDPSGSLCGARGFTVSMWIKLYSISATRLRFYLNSGDSGTSKLTIQDNRGVTIFSDASLIGVSISQYYTNWKLILDSNSYSIGQWVNLGILWSEAQGLTMLVDGISYGSSDYQGHKLFKGRAASPYVVLGRFNTDDDTTWLSPLDANQKEQQQQKISPDGGEVAWEMANFALGEVTYFERILTQTEYRKQFELLGSAQLRSFTGYLWYGADLVDPPVVYMTAAVKDDLPQPGPILLNQLNSSVFVLRNPQAVKIMGDTILRIGPIQADSCPAKLDNCIKGLSTGAWIRLGGPRFTPAPTNTTPVLLLTGSNGDFGITMQQNGLKLGAWVFTSQGSWTCAVNTVNLASETMNMQWIHVAFVWGPQEGHLEFSLQLLLNGQVLNACPMEGSTSSVQTDTSWIKTAAASAKEQHRKYSVPTGRYILMDSKQLYLVGSNLSVAVLAIQPTTLTNTGLLSLLGVSYLQWVKLQRFTFYWTFSGILRELAQDRATPYMITYGMDKDDTPLGAWCTQGISTRSYITLTGDLISTQLRTNLAGVCLIDPKKCREYAFVIDFKLLSSNWSGTSEKQSYELFRSTPLGADEDTVGLVISLQPANNMLTVDVRNEIQLFSKSVLLNYLGGYNSWISLEVLYSETGIKLRKSGLVLPTLESGSTALRNNNPLSSTVRATLNFIVGREVPVCVSSVAILDVPDGQNAETLMDGLSSSSCYPEVDYINELKDANPDQNNQSESATQLDDLQASISISTVPCLYNPDKCSSGTLIASLWARIDGFKDAFGQNVTMDAETNVSYLQSKKHC